VLLLFLLATSPYHTGGSGGISPQLTPAGCTVKTELRREVGEGGGHGPVESNAGVGDCDRAVQKTPEG